MPQPDFYIIEADYRRMLLTGSWQINEVPLNVAQQVRGFFGVSSSFALFISGAKDDPSLIRPEDQVLAGIDWIRNETNPKPGEPDFNVYHYFVGNGSAGKYPVYYCGHSGSVAPGWSTLKDLEVYFATTGSNQPTS